MTGNACLWSESNARSNPNRIITGTSSALQAEYEFQRKSRNEYRQEAELPSLRYKAELRNENELVNADAVYLTIGYNRVECKKT
jgi:hypothetical protein